jgi:hypothetical protein
MKRTLVFLTVVAMLLAACAVPGQVVDPTEIPPTQPPAETPEPIPTDSPDAAHKAAIAALAAMLGIEPASIRVVETEAVEWSDSCLGVVRINAICAAVITPGFRIVLEADEMTFVVHTDADGSAWTLAPVSGGAEAEAAEQAAREALARALGLADYEIMVVSVTPVEWSNACLGVEWPGQMCAEVITPGYKIVLEAHGVLFEYHTDSEGTAVRAASLALTWSRQGGIAGFCDGLWVYRSGEALRLQCGMDDEVVAEGALAELLSEGEVARYIEWLREYGQVSVSSSDPAVADAMTVELSLDGLGSTQPDEAGQQALVDWAQDVFNALQR